MAGTATAPRWARDVPIVRDPGAASRVPVVVSIPHFGTGAVPGIVDGDYREPRFASFPFGYTDPFAAQIYGELHHAGAIVVATPISRLFVDVNRTRDDFELRDGAVQSDRGVIRTHIRGDEPLFRVPLAPDAAERRLAAFYDPYHAVLRERLALLRRHFGNAVLVDAHTANAERLRGHEVVIGTCRGRSCSEAIARGVASIVRAHGFRPSFDVAGYSGGHIVRAHGARTGAVQALQIEFNATRLMRTTRQEFAEALRAGAQPPHDAQRLARCVECMREVVGWLGRVCATRKGAGATSARSVRPIDAGS